MRREFKQSKAGVESDDPRYLVKRMALQRDCKNESWQVFVKSQVKVPSHFLVVTNYVTPLNEEGGAKTIIR